MLELLSADSLVSVFKQCEQATRIIIGYSGGVDSHVLLHVCANYPAFKDKLTAVYVHHGLQAEADAWAVHCANITTELDVKFKVFRVNATPEQGESPEEAARNARYNAFKALIAENDVLLVAQHREDQLETVLLQLFRGSGLKGLSGMPEAMEFGKGQLLRPFLTVSKQAIDAYALENALSWITDPSNFSNDYDRNFLRNAVLPLLKQRWPACDKTVSRSAKHCAEAQTLISEQAKELFARVFNSVDETLLITPLISLDIANQDLVIREWFKLLGYKMPSAAFVKRLRAEVVLARQDSDPILTGAGYTVRRYRDKLYCLAHRAHEIIHDCVWSTDESSVQISEHQILERVQASSGISFDQWQQSIVTVQARKGGEKLRLPNRTGRHALKDLFQEAGIPPWERGLTPLIYLNEDLVAVGDLWISADYYQVSSSYPCVKLKLSNV
jgi:tRNA(Ile)-lysidine synthase